MSKLEDIIADTLIDHSLSTDAKLESLAEYFTELLDNFVEDEDCRFDHNHSCQSHNYFYLEQGEKCPQYELKELLGKLTTPTKGDE